MGLDPTALTDVATARAYLRESDADQALLELLINAYSLAVARYCAREFKPVAPANDSDQPIARPFRYDASGFLSLEPFELRSLGGAGFGGTGSITFFSDLPTDSQAVLDPGSSTTLSQYRLEPRGKTPEGTYLWLSLPETLLYPKLYVPRMYSASFAFEVSISGYWGMASVPADVVMATLIAIENHYRNPEGFASRSLGQLGFTEASESSDTPGRSLPPDARALLGPFRRTTLV